MIERLTFVGIVGFWLAMNLLLWREEYGGRGDATPVPVEMVWRKILTAPDPSSLTVYQNGKRAGYAEFTTSVGQQMAELDEDKVPPEGLAKNAGYQVHLASSLVFGGSTNRMKLDGRVRFASAQQWQEFNLRITSRLAVVELRADAKSQIIHLKITGDDATLERDLTLAELENPGALVRVFAGNSADAIFGAVDLPEMPVISGTAPIAWDARRTRVKIGPEAVPVYRLETSVLGHVLTVDVSTLGEILRVELPGGISARIDEMGRP